MTSVVLASCRALPTGDGDDDQLLDALVDRGLDVRWQAWDDVAGDDGAADADLVVLRTTWDYTERLPEFLDWTRAVARLANPAAVVAWSVDKRYLLDLAQAGVPVIATAAFAPGEQVHLSAGEVVVKPAVGAGSHGAARFTDHAAALVHAERLHATGTTVLVQPFEPSVDTVGETAMVLVRGEPSHAFHKAAMLAPEGAAGSTDGSGLFVVERLGAATPTGVQWQVGRDAVGAACTHLGLAPTDLLYARVDVLGVDRPRVLELELVEPSLGWRQVPEPQRGAALTGFADGVMELVGATR